MSLPSYYLCFFDDDSFKLQSVRLATPAAGAGSQAVEQCGRQTLPSESDQGWIPIFLLKNSGSYLLFLSPGLNLSICDMGRCENSMSHTCKALST